MRTKLEIKSEFAARDELALAKRFVLVGIGGAGMSGIATILLRRGMSVLGCDAVDSPIIQTLRSEGAVITIGPGEALVQPGDALVLSDAIDLSTSSEVAASRALGVPLFRRSQVLGWLIADRRTIAVTGTHGKTTTTAMLASGMIAAGMDPLVVVGAEVPSLGGAVVLGDGEWAVVEACEAYDAYQDLDPEVVVLTNLELDHVDFHGDWAGLRASVSEFLARARPGALLVYNEEDAGACEVAADAHLATVVFGSSSWAEQTSATPLAAPGTHNRLNAAAALLAGRAAGADSGRLTEGIATFGGASRRLQTLYDEEVAVIDDYAHHPTEIRASISALREAWPGRRLVLVFQPHLYSRTAPLIAEFASALSDADLVVLTDIYPARERPIPGIGSIRIAECVTVPCHTVPSRHLLPRRVARWIRPGDVVVGMGAGNIAEFAPAFVQELGRKTAPRNVAVVFGGDSDEREVSILSAAAVVTALRELGWDAWKIDVSELILSGRSLEAIAGEQRPDVAFLAVHGSRAEDGAIQGFFELAHVPYTGSGMLASGLAFDKHRTKLELARVGIPCPRGAVVRAGETWSLASSELRDCVAWVVKPNAQGSTVGLSFVDDPAELPRALERAWHHDVAALVEERVRGIEISVPVLGDDVFPAVEIIPQGGAYDFAAKYVPGATEEVCPARIDPAVAAEAAQLALRAHQALGCSGCTRTDMIVDGDRIVVLEVNTLPGLTETSLVPRSAAAAGIPFTELCRRIVEDALDRSVADG